jgi:predicted DNA-binding transcriptional regulator AlpA
MNEPTKNIIPIEDSRPLFSLTVGEYRQLRDEKARESKAETSAEEEDLIDVHEAAKLLNVTTDWLYHRTKTLPFVRKLGPRTLRYSRAGLYEWRDGKKR